MNHAEKSELLWEFAKGVENHDWDALEQTLKRFDAMRDVTIARQMQREFYHKMITGDDEQKQEDYRQANKNLEIIKRQCMER